MTTAVKRKKFITLTSIAADYDRGVDEEIYSIQFNPGAAGDLLVVKDGSDTGPNLAVLGSTDGDPRIKYLGGRLGQIYIDYTACTLSSGHSVDITF